MHSHRVDTASVACPNRRITGAPRRKTVVEGPMLIRRPPDIRSSDITDERAYFNRREFVKTVSAAAVGAIVGTAAPASSQRPVHAQEILSNVTRGPLDR